MNITIKTGANISRALQSTVTTSQAFTELVKNSIQNKATFCRIDLFKDSATILDDGKGFSIKKDKNGKNDFEKYFVFGNSYDTTDGTGLRLGQMGIGGKLSNDKLSQENSPHWQIETKNNGQHYRMKYNPPQDQEFLDDYLPEVEQIENSKIETDSGTRITILSLRKEVQKNGWDLDSIENELKSFFGELIYSLKETGKKFSIYLNGENLDFSHDLAGSNIPEFTKSFNYELNEDTRPSKINFKLSLLNKSQKLADCPPYGMNIISKVKIKSFALDNDIMLDRAIESIYAEHNVPKIEKIFIKEVASRLIGFISCDDLSEVLDESGLPAKDLSHHNLREDHPITTPFLKCIYKNLTEWIINYINVSTQDKDDVLQLIANKLSGLVASLNLDAIDDSLFLERLDPDGDITKTRRTTGDEFRESVNQVIYGKDRDIIYHEKSLNPPEEDNNNAGLQKDTYSRYAACNIFDFPESEKYKMSKFAMHLGGICINSANPKYLELKNHTSVLLISMHIIECVIKEATIYSSPSLNHEDLIFKIEEAIGIFYESKFEEMEASLDKTIVSR